MSRDELGFAEAILLGLIQGVAEWLPVSSEGMVTLVHSLVFDSSLSDAVGFSLWLHLGTSLSAFAAFRGEVAVIVRDAVRSPMRPSPVVVFLVLGTAISMPIGFALVVGLDGFPQAAGAVGMAAVGALMTITGAGLLLRRAEAGRRMREDLGWLDAVLTAIAQGAAALPGLSRSGLTVSALLARGVDRTEALTLSFLLSIPASLGAGLYAALDTGAYASPESVVALLVAAVVGFATIKALMRVANRFDFGWFVLIVGIAIVVGGIVGIGF